MRALLLSSMLSGAVLGAPLTVPADRLAPNDASVALGHDFARVIDAALKIKPKSEFESAAGFQERIQREAAAPVYGTVSVGGQLALRLGRASSDSAAAAYYKFNPETQSIAACLPYFGLRYAQSDRMVISHATAVNISEKINVTGSFIGRNAFNATVKARRQTRRAVDVLIPVSSLAQECADAAPMTSNDARRILPASVMVIVGHLESPFAQMVETLGTATIGNPVEEHAFVVEAPFFADELLLVSPTDGVIYRQRAPIAGR